MKPFTWAALCMSLPFYAMGNDEDIVLPTIKIHFNQKQDQGNTGSKTDGAMSIELLPQTANTSVETTLLQSAWVQSSNADTANPTFTLKNQRATVLLNGASLNQFNSQAQNIALIPTNTISAIEISPMASSVLYGSMGLAGVIDIKQKYIDHDLYSIGGNMAYQPGGGINYFINQLIDNDRQWALQFAGDTATTDGYRDYSRNFTTVNSLALRQHNSMQDFTLSFADSYQYLQFPGAVSDLSTPWAATSGREKYINHTTMTKLDFKRQLSNNYGAGIQALYQQQWAKVHFPDYHSSSTQDSLLLSLRPTLDYSDKRLDNTFGSDFSYQTFSQSAIIDRSSQTNAAIFDQLTVKFNKRWQSGVGGRYEYSYTHGAWVTNGVNADQHFNLFATDIFTRYNWNDSAFSRFSLSYAYQLPFIDQSSYTPQLISGFGLDPQTAWIYQLDNAYDNAKFKLNGSLYWMEIKNQIAYAQDGNTGEYYNINLDPTATIGTLLSLDYTVNHSFIPGVSLAINDNFFTNGIHKGNVVPGAAPINADMHATIHFNDRWKLWLQEQYSSSQYADSDYSNNLGKEVGYFLTNLLLSYEIDNWHFNLRVNNVFNKYYYGYVTSFNETSKSYYPADGINGSLSAQYTFG
ncbi:MAG: TonB-dependent receptor [Francisellaceae bacterium]